MAARTRPRAARRRRASSSLHGGPRGLLASLAAVLTLLTFAPAALATAAEPGIVSSEASSDRSFTWTPKLLRQAAANPLDGPAEPANPPLVLAAPEAGEPLEIAPAAAGEEPGVLRMFSPATASPRAANADPFAKRGSFTAGEIMIPEDNEITRPHGRVFFLTEDGAASCSGTVVNSNQRNLIATAGHCVHEGNRRGGFFKNWVFVPAYQGTEPTRDQDPYGIWKGRKLYTTAIFAEFSDPTGDFALAEVGRINKQRIQDVVGARGIAFGQKRDQLFSAYGYPADPNDGFDGETMRFCIGRFAGNDDMRKAVGPKTISMGCDMTGGASGGGWVNRKGLLNSVVSYGYPEQLPDVIFGPYLGSLARDIYAAAVETCMGEIVTIYGSSKRDKLVGTNKSDVIAGLDGNDTIKGRGGKDIICGGSGNDKADGGGGKDELSGEGGKDTLNGGKGKDRCRGGQGKDKLKRCERGQ